MVTLNYQGAGLYRVYFPDKMIQLSQPELEGLHSAMEEYNTSNPDSLLLPSRQELIEKVSDYEFELKQLSGLVDDKDEEILILENMLL